MSNGGEELPDGRDASSCIRITASDYQIIIGYTSVQPYNLVANNGF
jgi:hypothetical protein